MKQTNTKNKLPITSSYNLPNYLKGLLLCACLWLMALPLAAQEYIYKSQFGTQGTGDGQFIRPVGLAVDGQGNVYVADNDNHRVQKFDAQGSFLLNFGVFGSADGQFKFPIGVAVDEYGNVYVTDYDNRRIQKFDTQGNFLTKFGTFGNGDGQMIGPYGVTVDGQGNVYVADTFNHRWQKFDAQGVFLAKFGTEGTGDGQFQAPVNIALDEQGNIYVADLNNHRIQKFDSQGNFLTKFGTFGSGDGQFQYPYGVTVDGQGNVYVADQSNHRIQKFDSQGNFLTKFGSQGSGDGQFQGPFGVAVDAQGSVYVSDLNNHRVQVFAINIKPDLSTITDKSADELSSLEFQASATDDGLPDNSLTYSLEDAETGIYPTGAAITAAGAFSWIPTEAQGPGTYRVKVVVSDGDLSDEEEIEIQVNEVVTAPALSAIGNKTVAVDATLSFTIFATDADIPAQPLIFSASPLPAGAAFNTATRTFSWTPTASQVGNYNVTFRVSDGEFIDEEVVKISVPQTKLASEEWLWSIPTEDPILSISTRSHALIASGNDHYGNDGVGKKINIFTGAILAANFPSPASRNFIWVTEENVQDVLIGGYSGKSAYNLDGSLKWVWTDLGCCNGIPMSLDFGNKKAYTVQNNQFFAVDVASGVPTAQLYGISTFAGFTSIAQDGMVYTSGTDGVVSKINPTTGQVWSVTVDVGIVLRTGAVAQDGSYIVTSGSDHVGAVPDPGRLARVLSNGTIMWNNAVNAVTPPVIGGNDLIFIGTQPAPVNANSPGNIKAYNLETGAEVWSTYVDGLPNDIIVADDGKIYAVIGSFTSGKLFVLDQATGEISLVIDGLPGAWELILQSGVIYTSGSSITAIPVDAQEYDPASPWPARYHDNQRTSNIASPHFLMNHPPILATIGNKTVVVGRKLTFTVTATDADLPAQTLNYSASPLPKGATFNATTRTFSWTPTSSQPGTYNVTFSVSDGALTDAEVVIISVVTPADQKATITSFSPTSGPVGTQVTITGTNLLSTTQVTFFNGKTATNLQVVSASTVKATVPAGAKSGKITLITASGTVSSSTNFTVTAGLAATAVQALHAEPEELMAYPNPFSDKAIIEFALIEGGEFSAVLYDAKGARVGLLKEGIATAGSKQTLEVDGATLTKGLYLVRLQTREGMRTVKLVLTK